MGNSGFAIVWAVYVLFMIFGVLNVLTGVFVDSAMRAAEQDREQAIAVSIEEQNSYVQKIKQIFYEADRDHSGTVSYEELKSLLQNQVVQVYLRTLGVEASEACGLFVLLDADSSGSVCIEEFVSGCIRLKGEAKAVDVAYLMYENKKLLKR